jgi:CheY-like chemotaxis protein/anti-sigma regulatory factor (Ser/Thr protein kinase)
MNDNNPMVLVVDDDEFNLELITEYLRESEIITVCVDNGEIALKLLKESPEKFSTVLLDRMMPGIDGMEVLSRIKSDPVLTKLPVIMQTAQEGRESMLEGLQAGSYYYLTKPYDRHTLLAIIRTAVNDYLRYCELQANVKQTANTLKMMNKGKFTFKTLQEARNLAALLANACSDADHVVLGLTELMINAVEHGNLGISYEEKTRLNATGEWEQEVERRLNMPENASRRATVVFERNETKIMFIILDQGTGFEWKSYLNPSPDRAFDSHGRGIAMAKSISFDQIEFRGNGNEVSATVMNQE